MLLKDNVLKLIKEYKFPKTKTYTYLLPFLGIYKSELLINKFNETVYDSNSLDCLFINCYMGDEKYPVFSEEPNVLLLYRFIGTKEFLKFEDMFKNCSNFVSAYDPYSCFVMYVFKITDFVEDYKLIVQGKYSKISERAKERILEFHGLLLKGNKSEIAEVLYRLPPAYLRMEKELNKGLPESQWVKIPRDQEISSVFNPEREIFKYKDYLIKDEPNPNI